MLKHNKTKVNTAFNEVLLACFVWCVSAQYTPLVISCPDIELLLHAVPHHLYTVDQSYEVELAVRQDLEVTY